MNLQDVEKLILLMQQYDLNELRIKEGEWEFSASRGEKPQPGGASPAVIPAPVQATVAEGAAKLKEITAPIVGTFYRAPAPDQAPYKEVGDHVNADDVICIVEAMKVMNDIKAGLSGTLRKVLVENATAVEFGQPLFQVEVG